MNAKRLLIRSAVLLILCVLASAGMVGAFALSHSDPLLYADLSKADFQFDYTPLANSEYALYLYSADGKPVMAKAELIENGEIIASGEGSGEILSSWLAMGTRYAIRVHGSGKAVIEMARNALSRCSGDPLWVSENSSNGKLIARAYDAHWYAFTAEDDGEIMLFGVPEEGKVNLRAMLFDENGALIANFEGLDGGACRLRLSVEGGRDYFIRVSAPDGSQGYYHMNLLRIGETENPAFSHENFEISMGGSMDLTGRLTGEAVIWTSDNPDVVSVNQDGRIYGLHEGSAEISAHGFGAAAVCRVLVKNIPLEDIAFMGGKISLAAGDDASVELKFTPADASVQAVKFWVDDPELAQISENGVLQAMAAGETLLHVSSADGKFSDSIVLEILPAARKYRALLVGEQNYPPSVNSNRNGSENSVNAIARLLNTMDYESAAFQTRTGADLSRAELIYEIRSHFRRATEQDLSLLYISCHGSYQGGMSFLELSDGSSMAVRELERELRRIKGTVVVMIDCCASGGAIGEGSDYAAFASGVTDAFSRSSFALSKYKVICSAGWDQDSFRIAFNESAAGGVMATVFARALCDGAGWDIDLNARSSMDADRDYDRSISLAELADYMCRRVNWYLDIASNLTGGNYTQSIQVYPEDDPFILFER